MSVLFLFECSRCHRSAPVDRKSGLCPLCRERREWESARREMRWLWFWILLAVLYGVGVGAAVPLLVN